MEGTDLKGAPLRQACLCPSVLNQVFMHEALIRQGQRACSESVLNDNTALADSSRRGI